MDMEFNFLSEDLETTPRRVIKKEIDFVDYLVHGHTQTG
jgi:hypothetical protein